MTSFQSLADYDGPLGALEAPLARRRIAVAADGNGEPVLLRPDSLVLHFGADDDEYGAVEAAIREEDLDVLGGTWLRRPTTGSIGARLRPAEPPASSPTRWRTGRLLELADRLSRRVPAVQLNHVYLADGVRRQFGLVGDGGSGGTPGQRGSTTASLESTVRPASPPRRLARPLNLPGHRRPNVLVLDTGLRTYDARAEHPALTNCIIHHPWRDGGRAGRWDDEDQPDDDRLGRLDQQAGHGTFISGIIRQLCPDAHVHHTGTLTSYGDGDDASVSRGIERSLRRVGSEIDIVVMAFGTYAAEDLAPSAADAIRALPATCLVIAAAGNDDTTRPCFPAALPGVVGVGALDQGARARFSNFGSWVDACAPGVEVVSTFFTHFDDVDPGRGVINRYRGWASWSGTSFSAPKVASVVAQEMYLHGGTAQEAWARLSRPSALRLPDLGVVVNV